MRVLNIIPGSNNGIGRYILNKGKLLSRKDIVLDVISSDVVTDYFDQEVRQWGGHLWVADDDKEEDWLGCYRQILQSNDYQAIFWHHPSSLIAKAKFLSSSIPFYIHIHLHTNRQVPSVKNEVAKTLSTLTDAYVGCSRLALQSAYQLDSSEYFTVIPNSIDWHKIVQTKSKREKQRQIIRKQLDYKENDLVVGFIGRLVPEKNVSFVLQMALKSLEKNQRLKFLIIGDGVGRPGLEQLIQDKQLSNVQLVGWVEDATNYLYAIDHLVLPSQFEGLPTVIVEAQAAGVRCLVSGTLTSEVDFGLGLVGFKSLTKPEEWNDWIIQIQRFEIPSDEKRYKVFEQLGYTNERSAEIYENFLKENQKEIL